jgi:autonomous glycyl radical cofactor GrcA
MICSKGFSGSCVERKYRSPTVRCCPVLRMPAVPLVVVVRAEGRLPELTVRVSGYAVNFVRLAREQQLDVISRTFHGAL